MILERICSCFNFLLSSTLVLLVLRVVSQTPVMYVRLYVTGKDDICFADMVSFKAPYIYRQTIDEWVY